MSKFSEQKNTAEAEAQFINVKITAYDFSSVSMVEVRHSDFSIMWWRHAFVRELGDYFAVFTEHNGYHLFHKDDLEYPPITWERKFE